MAWEDARVSHTANGVYAAMWMAAVHAASLTESLVGGVRRTPGLSVVPGYSRLAEALLDARELARSSSGRRVVDELYERYGELHWVHAINNTALVAAALVRVRRRLLGRDLRRRAGRLGHRHERRRRRLDPRRARRAGGSTSAGRRRSRAASRARCRASTRSRSTSSHADARDASPAVTFVTSGRGAARPARPAADRPADGRAARAGRRSTALDGAKILAAPDDPADWPAWREALARWRDEAARADRLRRRAYERPGSPGRSAASRVALVWLWDERLYDHAAGALHARAALAEAEREFGGFDGIVLWHAYPVIGIDERNQFDWYRDVPGLRELVADLRGRGIRVFVDYNPWDAGTRREPVARRRGGRRLVRELGADGVFLDTMKEARPELRRGARPDVGARGRVDAAARAHRRPPPLVGAVVRRQPRCPGVIRREVVRAAAHAPPHAPLEPQTTSRSCTAPG